MKDTPTSTTNTGPSTHSQADADPSLPPLHMWLTEPLRSDARGAIDLLRRAEDVAHLAVMPDVHRGEHASIGVVLATRQLVYPMVVGGDIGCGITAAALDLPASALRSDRHVEKLFGLLKQRVPIMRHHRRHAGGSLPAGLELDELSDPHLRARASREALLELGTLGRGNHFLEIQEDQEGRLWLMIHSGSRAIGQEVTKHHLACAIRTRGGLAALDAGSSQGRMYLNDLQWSRRYAAANRRAMLDAAGSVLSELFGAGLDTSTVVDCDHNHARIETHSGTEVLVHRKGASSASLGEVGLIPGSMGTASYHVTGRGCAESLRSSSHGAGRAMSRSVARTRIRVDELRRRMRGIHFDVRASSRLVEESPGAYKDITAVMRAQRDLVRIERTLRPVLVYKGT